MKPESIRRTALSILAVTLAVVATPLLATDNAKAQRELEIMTGILETTLGFVNEPTSERVLRSFGDSEVEGYLLPGQGVVFLVSLQHRLNWTTGFLEAAELAQAGLISDRERVVAEDRVQDLKAVLKREQEETQKRLEKRQQQFKEARRLLVEAIAEYGGSFTTLEDSEHINLILRGGNRSGKLLVGYVGPVVAGAESPSRGSEVITIRRSTIREYKAGSLTLDQLTTRVLGN